jgi:hypothetical protein
MTKTYGAAPVDRGYVALEPTEMMFWLYCPIKLPRSEIVMPPNLRQFSPIVERVKDHSLLIWHERYVYLTAKTLWVTPDNPGNRPGWHSDGFMTDDLNFVWSDRDGTLFWEPPFRITFTQDHKQSMREMAEIAEPGPHRVYPDKHLLQLDETVIHRVPDIAAPGMRSFVKVSISRHPYQLKGNSINYLLDYQWEEVERQPSRNCPTGILA